MINLTIKLNDFLKAELLGNKFVAIKGYEPVKDRETGQVTAYRLNISLQSEDSDFYMELIPVKCKNISPSVSIESLSNAKATPVILKDLKVGQFNGTMWYSCDDVLPAK